ncbi:MAG: hypothetical protein WAS36_00445 [Candidatus Saccharimonadales bacterium]
MSKPIIAIDIDNVLAAHAGALMDVYNKLYDTSYKANDYDEKWAWINDDEKVQAFRKEILSSGVHRSMNVVPGASESAKRLLEKFDLVIITARWPEVSDITDTWVQKNFSGVFKDIHLTEVFMGQANGTKKSKADICHEIGAKYLIDDNYGHCKIAGEAGIHCVLFGDYAWNQTETLPANTVRCKDWQGVERYFGV